MLFVLIVLSPLLALVLLVLAGAHLIGTGSERPAMSWAAGAVISLSLGYLTYSWGAFYGFTYHDWDDGCRIAAMRSGESGGFVRIEHEMFPLRAECVRRDGTAFDMVPAFVNPVVYACIAALVICIAAAVYVLWRSSRSRQLTDSSDVTE